MYNFNTNPSNQVSQRTSIIPFKKQPSSQYTVSQETHISRKMSRLTHKKSSYKENINNTDWFTEVI
jgi:hypothetical protein